ncbi:DUF5694 domain-containing protein [Luteimonas sp. BDR2-5]|uniref:DUF5694 domain-containing protein n=1 Tax=Proluteimonas luteida TaxID=2878685 RepID=UPI001E2D5B2C|nr:DUF5694 domain-containing protein [Luteimonas sp. BDR2-5]MCD9029244.1 DUF5694 domain-containing protein [Luteimonas sp. BDR2-5]
MYTGRILAAMLVIAMPAASTVAGTPAAAEHPPGHAVDARLGTLATPRTQSEVMVLGTMHLSAFRDWLEPRHLEGTLALLQRFAPTRIAIERLSPDEIALLAERSAHDPAAARVLDQFARTILERGQAMQRTLGIDRIEAARRADALLAAAPGTLDVGERVQLVGDLIAAYEYDSAVLQWSYLSPAERDGAEALPPDIREALAQRLQGTDEVVRMATPLARTLGLQRLYPVDSQLDAARTMAFPEAVVDEVFGRVSQAIEADGTIAGMMARGDAARESGDDLLALNLDLNSYALQADDATQWVPWLTMAHPSGLDRFRYAMWELRNQRMAAHVMDVAASTRPERVLFIVGQAHKSYVDRALAPQLGVRLVQPAAFAPE